MHLILDREKENSETALVINDINLIDVLVCESEAKKIEVNFFLSQFRFSEIPSVIAKICSKLRMGGELIITEVDIEFIINKIYLNRINIEQINNLLFNNKYVMSVVTLEFLVELLKNNHIIITESYFDENNSLIIKGSR